MSAIKLQTQVLVAVPPSFLEQIPPSTPFLLQTEESALLIPAVKVERSGRIDIVTLNSQGLPEPIAVELIKGVAVIPDKFQNLYFEETAGEFAFLEKQLPATFRLELPLEDGQIPHQRMLEYGNMLTSKGLAYVGVTEGDKFVLVVNKTIAYREPEPSNAISRQLYGPGARMTYTPDAQRRWDWASLVRTMSETFARDNPGARLTPGEHARLDPVPAIAPLRGNVLAGVTFDEEEIPQMVRFDAETTWLRPTVEQAEAGIPLAGDVVETGQDAPQET